MSTVKPKRQNIVIQIIGMPPRTVPASVYGPLAVHGSAEEGWTVTHVPSGYRFCTWCDEREAREACRALLSLNIEFATLPLDAFVGVAPTIKRALAPWVPHWRNLEATR